MPANAVCIVDDLALVIAFEFKNELDIIVFITGGDVNMEMENRLSCNGAIVGENIKPLEVKAPDDGVGDRLRYRHDPGKGFGGEFQKILAMPLGDDERMPVMDRVNIEDADGVVVFVQNFGGDFAGNNVAKNAVGHRMESAIKKRV